MSNGRSIGFMLGRSVDLVDRSAPVDQNVVLSVIIVGRWVGGSVGESFRFLCDDKSIRNVGRSVGRIGRSVGQSVALVYRCFSVDQNVVLSISMVGRSVGQFLHISSSFRRTVGP